MAIERLTIADYNNLENKPNIPSKTSDLTNDSGFITSIPQATRETLGGVKVGSGLNMDDNGTLSKEPIEYIDGAFTGMFAESANEYGIGIYSDAIDIGANQPSFNATLPIVAGDGISIDINENQRAEISTIKPDYIQEEFDFLEVVDEDGIHYGVNTNLWKEDSTAPLSTITTETIIPIVAGKGISIDANDNSKAEISTTLNKNGTKGYVDTYFSVSNTAIDNGILISGDIEIWDGGDTLVDTVYGNVTLPIVAGENIQIEANDNGKATINFRGVPLGQYHSASDTTALNVDEDGILAECTSVEYDWDGPVTYGIAETVLPIVAGDGISIGINENGKAEISADGLVKSSELSAVAITGNYQDLVDKPSLFSGSYSDLSNKPTINGVELTGAKTSELLKLGVINGFGGFKAGTGASVYYGGAVGKNANASSGGAIGQDASATEGGAVGHTAKETDGGGAVGWDANASSGGAIGKYAATTNGFAGGYLALAHYAADGTTEIDGAVAIGHFAKAQADNAVQLGTGVNANADTLQFKNYQLLDSGGKIPSDRLNLGNYYTQSEIDELIQNVTPKYCEDVTYARLKYLRDLGILIPGMQYRITDYVTTTSQENTLSAGHQFDIVVTALSNDTLSENASVDYHRFDGDSTFRASVLADDDGNLVEGAIVAKYYIFEDYSGTSNEGLVANYKSTDVFIAYTYLENDKGVVVPVIYKTDVGGRMDNPEEFDYPDYEDTFYYEGIMKVDGVTYDKWRKITHKDDSDLSWESDGKVWVLTNSVISGATDAYFENAKLEAWEIKYCLDNDKTRFAWACNSDEQMIVNLETNYSNGQPLTRQPDFDGLYESEYYYAWGTQADADDGDSTNFWFSKNEILTNGEDLWHSEDGGGIAEVVDAGKGVIYYMKDEFNNECPYDFKNIQFIRKLDEEGNLDLENGTDTWCYTFGGKQCDRSITQDGMKEYNNNSIGSYYIGCEENFHLPANVFLATSECMTRNNKLGNDCTDNTFGDGCQNNTLGNNCDSNVFGRGYRSNTFGNDCDSNVFGNNCATNTFGDNCGRNTFGDSCDLNTLRNDCVDNTFGNICRYNTLNDKCCSNTLPNNTNLSKFEKAIYNVTLTSDAEGDDDVLQYITIACGVSGTWDNIKVIQAKANADYEQIFRKSGAQEILVD